MKAHERKDPVAAMVCDCTPEEFVEWLVKYKHLPLEVAENVEVNLREQFKWHRLQGRLDRPHWLTVLAELWGLRGQVELLQRPCFKSRAEREELAAQAVALCQQIEKCGASPALTAATVMASALQKELTSPY